MAHQAQTFRIFVSSTFSDLKAERNALQAEVFPKLEEYCAKRGATFQAIDLRWGVSQEASHDQQTLDICLNEVRRCQAITPRPNFIILLGNRYGWCPPPAKIASDEFERIKHKTRLFDRLLLNYWYKEDKNALDPVYVLQPWDRLTYDEWADIETKLHTILLKGAEKANLPSDSQLKYWASATHQEILTGTFGDLAQPEHVFAFFREIDPPPPVDEAKEYLDLVETNGKLKVDQKAQDKLYNLKSKLINKLGRENVLEYNTTWKDNAPEQNHIKQLCQDVLEKLMVAIGAQLDQLEAKDDLDQELAAQMEFAEERRAYFIGREDSLKSISEYLSQRAAYPMIIWGDSGTGKSALMAQALVKSKSCFPKALLIFRFASSTPESTSSDLLPVSICHQINRAYDVDEVVPPVGDPGFIAAFEERLALANSNQPIIIFIDALDQIKGNIK